MRPWKLIFLIFLHLGIGQIAYRVPFFSTVYAYAVLLTGIYWALRGNAIKLAYVAAYLVGAEVLFRMTQAQAFWEFGKYSVGGIFLLYLLTRGIRNFFLPAVYFSFLLPSAFLLLPAADQIQARLLSGNLSGPFLLMLSVIFFSKVKITFLQLQNILLCLMLPVISILSIASYLTYTAESIYFVTASNVTTSGGFGPNQVSSMFGLGALTAYLLLFTGKSNFLSRALLFFIALLFATQSALTFSRSGVYTAVCSCLVATFYLVRKRKNFFKIFFTFVLLLGIGHFFVWPRLVVFTQGAIEKRFKETSMTNRESLAQQDLQIFLDNMLLGVGPGRSADYRPDKHLGTAGHTEFTRLLAEHGFFGIFSIIILLIMAIKAFLKKKFPLGQAVTAASLVWAVLFMAVNAMRIAAPSFMFGLAMIKLIEIDAQSLRRAGLLPEIEKEAKEVNP